ncbi:MAG: DUF2461 domain-containing protein [Thermoplasmata archaeon]|nr:MAG: DUF2461 domain-containing protein [Thermoplasmata archaeon]
MAYFDKRFLGFFEGLAMDNSKAYFDANRKVYEQSVRNPFKELVADMILRLREHEPEIDLEPKDAIFRINRDIRFSKDKTPYKTHVGAHISRGGRKDHTYPGFYFQLSHTGAMVAGGVWGPDKEGIHRVRTHIARDPSAFDRVVSDKAFKETFGEVQGDRLKRVPPEFKEVFEVQPYVGNKQWYYHADLGAEVVTVDDLPDRLMEVHLAGSSVQAYLREALSG